MADITIISGGLDTNNVGLRYNAMIAAEDILACEAVYISGANSVSKASNSVTTNGESKFIGLAPKDYRAGEPVTVFGNGSRFKYSIGMTPGEYLYVSSTAGKLTDEGAVGDRPVAIALNSTDIQIIR